MTFRAISRHRGVGGIAIKQSNAGGHGAGTTPTTTSAAGYSANTTAGSLLVCVVYASATSSVPTINIPSTSGFTWTLASSEGGSSAETRVAIYYITNASSMATSVTTTVTATATTGVVDVEFDLYEFSGVVTASPVDTSQVAQGTAATPSTANLSTSLTDLIIVAACGAASGAGAAGAGYTLGITASHQIGGNVGQLQYILNKPSGSIATAGFGTGWTGWGMVAIAFKP